MKLEWCDVSLGGPAISTSLTADETAELQRLAKDAEVLEIGSAYGYSAVAMALVGASVTAVDPHRWLNSYGPMTANLAAYGVADRVEIVVGDSRDVLPGLTRRFDLVWVDGDHEAHMVHHDVEWARKLLKPTGTLAVHDYDEETCPGVRMALDHIWPAPHQLVDTLAIYRGVS